MLETAEIVKVLKGQSVSRMPVWFMRQAGRYLPEYRELRKKHAMLDLIRSAELASIVTLQPIKRFQLDAAIIFADILNPLIDMGVQLDFVEGEGPKIFNPVRSENDVERLVVPDMKQSVSYTLKAIQLCVEQLAPQNIPLIGFAGAPFTLSCYLIEGGSPGDMHHTKNLMFTTPKAWHVLQEKLVDLISQYFVAQVESGASVLQLFDSWVGNLSPSQFNEFVVPYLKEIVKRVRAKVDVPLVYFSTGTSGLLNEIRNLDFDGVSIDWRQSLLNARNTLGSQVAIQGNLDPLVLAGPVEYLEKEVKLLINQGKNIGRYIFNLGHGILPFTPPENVERVISLVKNHS
jgi:uroporphyrinogen decarboxylase